MSRRVRLIGLAIAFALLADGVANYALAGLGACKPVRVCEPVVAVPVCKPVKVCAPVKVPVCKPVKVCAPVTVPACKPVQPLPPPEVCKPVRVCDRVAVATKHVFVHTHRLASRLKRHWTGDTVYEEYSSPATTDTPPTPAAPAPIPRSPAT
jgi:hypothetical protein